MSLSRMPYFAIAHQVAMLVAERAERAAQSVLTEDAGLVELGSGWWTTMPPGFRQRNADGSWSMWGSDWSMEIRISDAARSAHHESVDSPDGFDPEDPSTKGEGWQGSCQFQLELSGSRAVHHLSARLASGHSMLSLVACCVGIGGNECAAGLLRAVAHRPSRGIPGGLFRLRRRNG